MLVHVYDYSEMRRVIEVRTPLPDQLFLVSPGTRLLELSHDEAGRPYYAPQHRSRYTRPRWLERVLARHTPPTPPISVLGLPLPPGVYIDPRVYREGPNLPQEGVSYWMPARWTGVGSPVASAKPLAPKRAQQAE